jgi:hypothetical protein
MNGKQSHEWLMARDDEIKRLTKQNEMLVAALDEIATHSVCCDARHIADKALAAVKEKP